jgi:hypothetical protein
VLAQRLTIDSTNSVNQPAPVNRESLRDFVFLDGVGVSERQKGASERRFKRGQFDRKGMGHSDRRFSLEPSTGVGPWYVG